MPTREVFSAAVLQELVRRSNEDSRKLRSYEQRLQIIENRLASLEENSIKGLKNQTIKVSEIEKTITGANDELLRLKNTLEKMNRSLTGFASKKDIKEIEHMFELLSPLRNLQKKYQIEENKF